MCTDWVEYEASTRRLEAPEGSDPACVQQRDTASPSGLRLLVKEGPYGPPFRLVAMVKCATWP